MPVATWLPPSALSEPRRKRFTRAEVDRLREEGFFDGQRYELIEGDLIDKMGQNPPHALAVRRVVHALARLFSTRLIQVQSPVEAGEPDAERNLPEPDIAVLAEDTPEYASRHSRGDELVLLVEIADSTVAFDLGVKSGLYARAGVPEYWVLDLRSRSLFVHRKPADGRYSEVVTLIETGGAQPQAASEHTIPVADLLPGRT